MNKSIKTNGYSSETLRAKRNQRRIEAERRQCAHDSLTLSEKLTKIAGRRGDSRKEQDRLTCV